MKRHPAAGLELEAAGQGIVLHLTDSNTPVAIHDPEQHGAHPTKGAGPMTAPF